MTPYKRLFKEYTWKTQKQLPRDTEGGRELEQFCNQLKSHIVVSFQPANGFYEEAYSQKNVSIFADFGYDLGAIISYFPGDKDFRVKFQDTASKSAGWSNIEMLGDVSGSSFEEMIADIKSEVGRYIESYENERIEEEQ